MVKVGLPEAQSRRNKSSPQGKVLRALGSTLWRMVLFRPKAPVEASP